MVGVVVGSRGFLRAVVRIAGRAAHSGSRRPVEANAVTRAAWLASTLAGVDLGDLTAPDFPVPPKVTGDIHPWRRGILVRA